MINNIFNWKSFIELIIIINREKIDVPSPRYAGIYKFSYRRHIWPLKELDSALIAKRLIGINWNLKIFYSQK